MGGWVGQADHGTRLRLDRKEAGDFGQTEPPDVRRLLEQAGVRGPNLDILANAAGITARVVEEETRSLRSDRNVRNLPAVLVKRLAARAGIKLAGRPPLSKQDQASIARLEQLRRSHGEQRARDASIGEAVCEVTTRLIRPA
ncbi:MAG: hypothetical protein KF757_03365 [Phycisphaeraceae bacterium]|nr:hypothetical protein [Phycisphaeraceae bacterium]MCW5763044.1 hypothetical protein [Phycisphaeraceae bacterium]